MTLSIAISAIVLADTAIVGILAFVMTRTRLLTPHFSAAVVAIPAPAHAARPAARPQRRIARPAAAQPAGA